MDSLIAGHYWQMWAVLALVPVAYKLWQTRKAPKSDDD